MGPLRERSLVSRDAVRLLVSISICQLAGLLGSVFTSRSVSSWYPALAKSEFTPPGMVIGIVWTALFIMMGLALFLVWRRSGQAGQRKALTVFRGSAGGECLVVCRLLRTCVHLPWPWRP